MDLISNPITIVDISKSSPKETLTKEVLTKIKRLFEILENDPFACNFMTRVEYRGKILYCI